MEEQVAAGSLFMSPYGLINVNNSRKAFIIKLVLPVIREQMSFVF